MQRILGAAALTSEAIAEVVEMVVGNAASPAELHSVGDGAHDWVMAYEVVGGSYEPATLYRLQPYSTAEVMPFVVDSATVGLKWVAVAGRYVANVVTTRTSLQVGDDILAQSQIVTLQQVLSQNSITTTAIALDHNSATGTFTGSLSPVPTLTGDRRWLFPDANITVAGTSGSGVLTAGRVVYVAAGGALTDSASLLFSGSAFTVGDGTADKSVFAIGGNSGVNGGARFQVVNGAGTRIAIGNKSAIVGGAYDATPYLYSNGRLEIGDSIRVASTTAASSSITGAVIVGDGATTATNVGIGGGNIYAGTDAIIGDSSGGRYVRIKGGNSGTAGGASLEVNNNGTGIIYLGNTSAVLGGAYDATPLLWTNTASLNLSAGINVNGALIDSGTVAGDYICKIANASGTGLGLRVQAGADGNSALAVRNAASAISFSVLGNGTLASNGGTASTKFQVASTTVEVYHTTASSSSLTGSLIVGDTVTAATSVGIGGGNINAGGALTTGSNINANGPAAGVTISATSTGTQGNFSAVNTTASVAINAYNGTGAELTFLIANTGGANIQRGRMTAAGNIVLGNEAAIATNATNGFVYVPTCAGTPTGVPTAFTGMAPIVVNTTNNKLYFYSGGAWRDAGP